MDLSELTAEVKEMGLPSYRAKQIYQWLHRHLARDFEEMQNLPASLRKQLGEQYDLLQVRLLEQQESALDGTRKFLFELADGQTLESVFMRYRFGNTVCVSSQVGCRMGCRFCASTLDGLTRNLRASEILDQVYAITRITGERISHVVIMGTGEPLDNLQQVLRFIRLLTDENGLHISQRSITLSTCGLVPEMHMLADEKLSVTLALSLHASNDEKRKKIMPVANQYSIAELMEACGYYEKMTGRRITFEYSLIRGVNDLPEDAAELSVLAGKTGAHVNLIPINPVREREYRQSEAAGVQAFKTRLEKNGINVSIRRALGRDIDGACGQLRHRHIQEKESQK